MTNFTRDIKPVNYDAPRKMPAPTQSLAGDITNTLAVGLGIYGDMKNKKREAALDKMVGDLSSFEGELAQNGLSKRERLGRVDRRIRDMGLDPSQEGHLRQTLAQRRGSFVQRDIVAEEDRKRASQEQQLDAEFNAALSSAPHLFSTYKRNEDGVYSQEDKVAIVSDFEDFRIKSYQQQKATEKYQQKLAQGGEVALEGATTASQIIGAQVRDVYSATSSGFVQVANNLDLKTPEGIAEFEDILKQGRNALRAGRLSVESQYNALIEGQSDVKVRDLLEKNRDAALNQMDASIKLVEEADVSKAEGLIQDIQLIENGLKLKGLQNFPIASMVREIAPESSKYLIQAMISKFSGIQDKAVQELAGGLLDMDPSVATQKFGGELVDYINTGDTEKASDLILSTFYSFARDTITNMPSRDLSAGEVDKISGGLLGIMQEAAATDDPKQIKEATVLLNSPNFQSFFDQLPEERKAPMGRFISAFNQDVLIDSTDGLFKQMEGMLSSHSITYNAEKGEFVKGAPKTSSLLRKDSPSFQYVNVGKAIKDANVALGMIRANAQYDPVTQDSRQLIDTMIAERLPKGITVEGELNVFTAKEAAARTPEDIEQIRTNKEILKSLRDAVGSLSEGTLVNSPEFKKILEGIISNNE